VTGFFVLARARRALLLVGLAFGALPVGSALADTTVGQAGGTSLCTPLTGATFADTNYVVPASGTITSFSELGMSAFGGGTQVDFLALRPVTGSTYTVLGKTGLVTLVGTGLETFPANISVRAGDILGFWSNAFGLFNCGRTVASGGGLISSGAAPDPNTGDTIQLPFPDPTPFDLNESANLAPPQNDNSQGNNNNQGQNNGN
jgi:hypothetical protein